MDKTASPIRVAVINRIRTPGAVSAEPGSGQGRLAGAPPAPHLGGMTFVASLPARSVLSVSGADRVSFLQGLVSNDVALAGPGRAVWAALLTPQGKWLADFFIFADGERLLLDCEGGTSGGHRQAADPVPAAGAGGDRG